MTDETTTEQLAEIEGQGELITGPGLYQARCGDLVQITRWRAGWWVSEWKGIRTDYHSDGRKRLRTEADAGRWDLLHWVAPLPASEPEPETTTEQPAEIEGQAENTPVTEYTPPEGWRLVRFGELLLPGDQWVNWEGTVSRPDILHGDGATASGGRYIRLIKPKPQAEPQPQSQPAAIELLRSEVSYVQRLLGESRQRVTTLEELVTSLRTINEAQERAFNAANKANDDLEHRLNVVAAELVTQFETSRRLQIDLDAAQQVPADSPELRQLRAELEQVTRERDQHLDSYQRIFGDLETIRETTKAAAVEAIAEWLQPIRAVDNEHLANETLQHLPQIMRHLTGLDSHAID